MRLSDLIFEAARCLKEDVEIEKVKINYVSTEGNILIGNSTWEDPDYDPYASRREEEEEKERIRKIIFGDDDD